MSRPGSGSPAGVPLGEVRAWFELASSGFSHLVRAMPEDRLGAPGLGSWTVRDLLGHTTRAYLTIESYRAATGEGPWIASAAEYFGTARAATDATAIAARGVTAGGELGERAAEAALAIARRVDGIVAASSGAEIVVTPFGRMWLRDYLATRAFELTVHTADLARSLGLDLPAGTRAASTYALRLCAELATEANAADALALLTGRPPRDPVSLV